MTNGFHFARMCPIICIINIGASANLVRAYILVLFCLDIVCQRDMPEILSVSNKRLAVRGTITLYLRIGESYVPVILDTLDKRAVLVVLVTNNIAWDIKSIHPTKTKVVPYCSPSVPIMMVQDARIVAEKNEYLYIRQQVEENIELFLASTRCYPNNITVAW